MRPNLKKEITFIGVFSLAAGAMISSGIFILPGIAFSYAGPSVFISYFLAGAVALLGIFSMVELSTAMPRSGGGLFLHYANFRASYGHDIRSLELVRYYP